MNQTIINRWKDSASESFANNGEHAKESGCFTFEVTAEQKEYLEDNINEIDEFCKDEDHFGEETASIRFEPFFNGEDEVFTCECYFDKWYK